MPVASLTTEGNSSMVHWVKDKIDPNPNPILGGTTGPINFLW